MSELVSIHRVEKASLLASQPRAEKPRRPTPENPLITSASELATFYRCRVKHWWQYQCRLEPADKPEALAFGALGHDVMESFYAYPWRQRDIKNMRKVTKQIIPATKYKAMTPELKELLEAMCLGYAAWSKEENAAIGLRDCVPEREFLLPLVKDRSILIKGKLDTIFEPTILKRTIAAVERKFKKQIQMNIVEMNLQLSVYLWAMRALYPKRQEYQMHYRILRKQMPVPRVKADLFASESVTREDEEIHQWELDTQRTILDMIDGAVYPNPNDNCAWDCDFKVPCLLRGRHSDVKHALGELHPQFKVKEKRPA